MTERRSDFRAERQALLEDRSRTGRALASALAALVDEWLAGLFEQATSELPTGADGVSLVAVGGYGRSELCPGSDVDVVLLHRKRRDIAELAERLWYPVWDCGVPLGHAVRTVKGALALAAADLDTATSLLSSRWIAGDRALAAELAGRALEQWRGRGRHNVSAVAKSVEARRARAGEVAYLLEPDIKDGRGGLRDVHALGWAELARPLQTDDDPHRLDVAYETLLAVRVELHRLTGRRGNTLALEYQDEIAAALGDRDADALMARVAAAARAIAWTCDEAWDRARSWLEGPGRTSGRERDLGGGAKLVDGVVHADPAAVLDGDAAPQLVLHAASAAASHRTRIDRRSLLQLASVPVALPAIWSSELRDAFVELLLAGHSAVPLIEALDQVGLWERFLPEWPAVRNRPQRNAYHRFTVDRHLLEAVANAAALADRVRRPDLLVTAALLHDLGKGYGGDHVETGAALAADAGLRMGFPAEDVAVLERMVRHHLLLPDTAVRRDLDDPATVQLVVRAAGSALELELLHALCEADSLATGPAAWSHWKAELVDELVGRTRHALGEGPPPQIRPAFPSASHLELVRAGQTAIRFEGDLLTVAAPDRPGLLSRVAGTLALHGLDVISAEVTSTSRGMALEQFKVAPGGLGARDGGRPLAEVAPRVAADIERAIEGRLALGARIAERARLYRPAVSLPGLPPPQVAVDNEASAASTVIDVSAPDSIGFLYRVTRALAELDLDVHTAKVQTQGAVVVDAFYVVDRHGQKITDPQHIAEIERAIADAADPGRH